MSSQLDAMHALLEELDESMARLVNLLMQIADRPDSEASAITLEQISETVRDALKDFVPVVTDEAAPKFAARPSPFSEVTTKAQLRDCVRELGKAFVADFGADDPDGPELQVLHAALRAVQLDADEAMAQIRRVIGSRGRG